MVEIPLWRLAISLLPLIAVAWISFAWGSKVRELGIATARMIVQLLGIGYVLVFLFEQENPWLGGGIVLFMVLISSWIAIRTMTGQRQKAYFHALLGIGIGGGIVLALVLFGVLNLQPWFRLSYLIPLSGMIFANAMTAVTLSAERFDAERSHGKAVTEARNTAWNASLIPQINALLAVGLVSLPGMMTGQILAGASPLDAVRYQIMVMAMILGSAGLAVAIFLKCQTRLLAAPH